MKYFYSLLIRLLLCFIPMSIFALFLTPITIWLSYFSIIFLKPTIQGPVITVGSQGFNFIQACIAVAAYYLLWLLVMLTKDINLITRIKLILTTFGMLLAVNVIRIFILIILSTYFGFAAFQLVHMFMWEFMSGILVALIWIISIRIYKIKSIPIYTDLKYIYSLSKKK